ncbi:MAG: hypothetical protein QM811_12210 [Pirellulales bacterium]
MKLTVFFAFVVLFRASVVVHAVEAFQEKNLVVSQVGDGEEVDKAQNVPIVLKEFTIDGKLVQEIPLPTAAAGANHALTQNRNRVGGDLTRSTDGRFVVLGGVDLPPRSSCPARPVRARTIARVDSAGHVDTTTCFKDAYFSAGAIGIRSVVSFDGGGYWISGKGNEHQGVRYIKHGASTTAAVTDPAEETRHLAIADERLYVTPAAGVGTIGAGLPLPAASNALTTQLPGIPLSGWNSPVLLDLDPAVPGVDTLYVVEDRKPNFAKFKFDGKTWTRDKAFAIKDPNAMLFITGKVENGTVVLYGTTDSGSSGSFENELVEIRDETPTPRIRVLTKAKPNYSFRGVSYVPVRKPAATTAESR